MQVNVYSIDNDGTEHLDVSNVPLASCFPDDPVEQTMALHHLNTAGRFWTGGGAAPLFLLMRVRS